MIEMLSTEPFCSSITKLITPTHENVGIHVLKYPWNQAIANFLPIFSISLKIPRKHFFLICYPKNKHKYYEWNKQ
jgi:hypothetical protein